MANDAISGEIILASETPTGGEIQTLMSQIRPQWRSKGLIDRVHRLIPVDPSSACQRLINAAVADLREKIIIAGIDIAESVAAHYKLPPVKKPDDMENYSTAKTIDLAYRMGILTRPQWRRLCRSYEIRRDLEHEDVEYEATVEDCLYIFKTCIESVLAVEPIVPVKVKEVTELIQSGTAIVPSQSLLDDIRHAPDSRQLEISKTLYGTATSESEPDLVRQNAYAMLSHLRPIVHASVTVDLAKHIQEKIGRRSDLTDLQVRVANSAGTLPYLREPQRRHFFHAFYEEMESCSPHWTSHAQHGQLLRRLQEFGGLEAVTEQERASYVRWMTLLYIGEPGGRGAGINRSVFFSNTGAPLVTEILKSCQGIAKPLLQAMESDDTISEARSRSAATDRRFQELLDLVDA